MRVLGYSLLLTLQQLFYIACFLLIAKESLFCYSFQLFLLEVLILHLRAYFDMCKPCHVLLPNIAVLLLSTPYRVSLQFILLSY